MRTRATEASHSLFLIATIAAGWLLPAAFLPAHALATSASSSDSASEWTTTHSEEQSTAPSAKAAPKPASKNATAARSHTSRQRSNTSAKASGSGATQTPGKSGQRGAKEAKPEPVGIQLEKLFRGIGADLEEFFVGTRTVDKD